ncbi:hypothetical protein MMC22_001414 [Lobaria immixta]|nr:hypothetical protein [Lobaria immixta]
MDIATSSRALFSGNELKPNDGDKAEAHLQLSVWMAASLRKKSELSERAGQGRFTLPEPCITIVGHEHSVYFAHLDSADNVQLLRPDERCNFSTDTIGGEQREIVHQ